MELNKSYAEIEKQTLDIYMRNAAAFDAQRAKKLHEKGWLDRFLALLPPSGSVLDLGCGAAEPIAEYYINRGYTVTGVDFSPAMLKLAQSRFPNSRWISADMRKLELGETFHGITAWNSFFHLTQEDQRTTLTRLVDHLKPGGALMITVGPAAGEVIGHVNGEKVYHASLDPGEYERMLKALGVDIVDFVLEDPSCDMQTVLLAQKKG